ncbi:hypothetical protein BKA61DRAFT_679014 [Leptodontidium sp. MPI-SDFR-AT-0119]|nr:hypothetical protein BKA61DRAFT_679014 [Leptodontidium sp. MPI-SDFR-AT-0119]
MLFITQYLLFVATIFLLALTPTNASSTADLQLAQDEHKGYKFTPLHMTGTIGDSILNHTGTIQEIYAQLATEHPDFSLMELDEVSEFAVEARDKRSKSDWKCIPVPGQNWIRARDAEIDIGIAYLKKVKALCWVDGHACSRISCSWDSAITLCSVTPNKKGLSCEYMAYYAQDLRNRCTGNLVSDGRHSTNQVGGQAWDTDGYNVNVLQIDC